MEGIRTLEYRAEDREAELRKDAEAGRKARIAAEVLREFLDDRREEIVREFEEKYLDDGSIYDNLADLRSIAKFRRKCEYLRQQGEIAEEALRNGE